MNYTEVVDANRDLLSAQRAQAQLAGQRLISAVQLIKALGGGWEFDASQVAVNPMKSDVQGRKSL